VEVEEPPLLILIQGQNRKTRKALHVGEGVHIHGRLDTGRFQWFELICPVIRIQVNGKLLNSSTEGVRVNAPRLWLHLGLT